MKKIFLAAWLITVTFLAYADPPTQPGTAPAPAPNATPSEPATSPGVPNANNTVPASPPSANGGDSKSQPKQTLAPTPAKKTDTKSGQPSNTEEVKKECTIKPVMTDEDYYTCGTKPPGYVVHFENAK